MGSDLTGGDDDEEVESVLDEVKELILLAQTHGAWIAGVGVLIKVRLTVCSIDHLSVKALTHNCSQFVDWKSYCFMGVPQQLSGLPMSDKLKTQIGK